MKNYLNREEMIADLLKPEMVGAEVGVYRGGFSHKIADCGVAHLYCIDAWTQYKEYAKDSLCATNQDDNMEATKHELAAFIRKGKCTVIKGFSAAVARDWATPMDFLFLDSIHTKPFVSEDLALWSPHIKEGGFIMCHDFTDRPAALAMDFGVIPAVTEFCEANGWEIFVITQEPDWPSCAIRRK